ncbi:MAG: mechanosensitive ion channel [Bryobacteraceae bacterium]|nr:mechanosensitive ion channel [Bryobacteraceae bacterium]
MQSPAVIVDWAQGALFFVAALAVAIVARTLLLRALRRQGVDDSATRVLHDTLRIPSILWCVFVALAVTLQFAGLPERGMRWVANGNVIFLVLSVSISTSTLLVRLAVFYAQSRGLPFAMSGLSKALVHILMVLLGGAVLLRYFDISVAPLLTALGVGGLAVALALRDTLANFFAGIHILVEAPVSVGDFIQLSTGEEGTVTDIGWRTTRVLTPRNNIVVIPNEKITSSILTNFALPDPKVVLPVDLIAGLDADIGQITRIAVEEARHVEGIVPDFMPLLLMDPGALPTHLQFKLVVQVQNRLLQGVVASDIRRRVFERFRQESVPMPSVEQVALYKG